MAIVTGSSSGIGRATAHHLASLGAHVVVHSVKSVGPGRHRYLTRLRAEDDVGAWLKRPLTADETSSAEIPDWGPAEDWLDETG